MVLSHRVIPAVLVAAALAAAAPARAGTAGGRMADTRLFKPAVDSKGLFTVNASPILPHLGVSFGLVLDYANSVFALSPDPGIRQGDDPSLIGNSVWGTLHFNIGIANALVLGLQVPVGILGGQSIEHADTSDPPDGIPETGIDISGGDFTSGYESQGLGNVALHAKFRILRVEHMPVGLAAVVQVGLPTVAGRDRTFMGDPYGSLTALGVVDRWFSRRIKLALNVGFKMSFGALAGKGLRLENLPGRHDTFAYGHSLLWGLGAAFGLIPRSLDLVVEYTGSMVVTHPDIRHAPMEVDAGFKIFVERNSYLYLGAGFGGVKQLDRGYAAPSWRIFAAFIFEPSIGDRDADGLKDDLDQCPDDPEDRDAFEDLDGCPDPDNDRDGILDVDDDCPDVPEDRDEDADEDGCPEGEAGDRDGDGILDDADACPDDPEDPDGFEDINGCPDPDNDEDRILDVDDACPDDPEIYNGFEDENGCPDTWIVEYGPGGIDIFEKVLFPTDSAEIKVESHALLDAVAATIKGNPQIVHVQVQGHADERAPNDYNIQLTLERATAVVKYLVDAGVPDEMLSAAGYGEECPLNKAHTQKAWDENRRVEFKVLETTDGCTGVTVTCDKALKLALVPPGDEKYLPGGGYCE